MYIYLYIICTLLPKTYTKQNQEITNMYKTYAEHVSTCTLYIYIIGFTNTCVSFFSGFRCSTSSKRGTPGHWLHCSGQLPQGVLLHQDGLHQAEPRLQRGNSCQLWTLLIAQAISDAQEPLRVLACGHVPIITPSS